MSEPAPVPPSRGALDAVAAMRTEIGKAVVGQDAVVDQVLCAFLAGGNVLVEGVPGLGKTLLVLALARTFGGHFARIQFTPDLMPSDVTGHAMLDPSGQVRIRQGPAFTNLLLADEINRAPAKTQAALLEVMQERQITIEGRSYPVPQPFMALATQNPIEHEGTYPLPEAQLDRFAVQLAMGYPPEEEEIEVLGMLDERSPLDALQPVASLEDVLEAQTRVRRVPVHVDVRRYVVALLAASRKEPRLALGVSPRGGIALYRLAQAQALVSGRSAVIPDDVKAVAVMTLAHRVVLETKARYSGVTKEQVIKDLLQRVPVPV